VAGRAVVGDLVPGSRAAQLADRARLDARVPAALPGDVLRAVTCTTIEFEGYGGNPLVPPRPRRVITLFGADGENWSRVSVALRRGLVEDGPVTLVLERRTRAAVDAMRGTPAARAGPVETPASTPAPTMNGVVEGKREA